MRVHSNVYAQYCGYNTKMDYALQIYQSYMKLPAKVEIKKDKEK